MRRSRAKPGPRKQRATTLVNETPSTAHPETRCYASSIARRISSLFLPRRCCRRPSNSSSLPSAKVRSSSVNWAYFCFSLPLTSFQLPLIWSFVITDISRARGRVDAPAEFVELSWKTTRKSPPAETGSSDKNCCPRKPGSFVVSQMALETTTPAPEAVGNPRSCCSGLLARGGPSWEAKAARLNRLTNPRETDSGYSFRARRFGWASLILPGALIALLPKCPACLAAYVALATGLSLSIPVASSLRTALLVLAAVPAVWLVVTRTSRLISGARNPDRGVKPELKTNRGRERLLHCPGSCRPFATFSNPTKP